MSECRAILEATTPVDECKTATPKRARGELLRIQREQMMQILGQQLRLEKQREAELENMFQDEAAKEWDKRNEEWKRESEAREALMRQVLEERQQQIEEKFNIFPESLFFI